MSLQSLRSVYDDKSPTSKMVSIAVELYGGRVVVAHGRVADLGETAAQVNQILAEPAHGTMAWFPMADGFGRTGENIAFLTAVGLRWRVLSVDVKGSLETGFVVAAKLVHEGTTDLVPVTP